MGRAKDFGCLPGGCRCGCGSRAAACGIPVRIATRPASTKYRPKDLRPFVDDVCLRQVGQGGGRQCPSEGRNQASTEVVDGYLAIK